MYSYILGPSPGVTCRLLKIPGLHFVEAHVQKLNHSWFKDNRAVEMCRDGGGGVEEPPPTGQFHSCGCGLGGGVALVCRQIEVCAKHKQVTAGGNTPYVSVACSRKDELRVRLAWTMKNVQCHAAIVKRNAKGQWESPLMDNYLNVKNWLKELILELDL